MDKKWFAVFVLVGVLVASLSALGGGLYLGGVTPPASDGVVFLDNSGQGPVASADCVDCWLDLSVCNRKPTLTESEAESFGWRLRNKEFKSIDRGITVYASRRIVKTVDDYGFVEKKITCPPNATLGVDEASKNATCIGLEDNHTYFNGSYEKIDGGLITYSEWDKNGTKQITGETWEESSKDKLHSTLKQAAEDECIKIRLKPSEGLRQGESIDVIPLFLGKEYAQWAWWNNDWQKCRNITVTDNSDETLKDWAYEVNLTGLTFQNVNELRITSEACGEDGYQLPFYVKSSQSGTGDAWADVVFYANVSASATDKFSVYYDNAGVGASTGSGDMSVDTGNKIIKYDSVEKVQFQYASIEDITTDDRTHYENGGYGMVQWCDDGSRVMDAYNSGSCTIDVNNDKYVKVTCSNNGRNIIYEFFAFQEYLRLTYSGFDVGGSDADEGLFMAGKYGSGTVKQCYYRSSTGGSYSTSSGDSGTTHEVLGVYECAAQGDNEGVYFIWDLNAGKAYENTTHYYTRTNDPNDPQDTIFSTGLNCFSNGQHQSFEALNKKSWIGIAAHSTTALESLYQKLTNPPVITVSSEETASAGADGYIKASGNIFVQPDDGTLVLGETSKPTKLQMYSADGSTFCCYVTNGGSWTCDSGAC